METKEKYATSSLSEIAVLIDAGVKPIEAMAIGGTGGRYTAAIFDAEQAKPIIRKFNTARDAARKVLGLGVGR